MESQGIINLTPDLWQTIEIKDWAAAMVKFHIELKTITKDKKLKMFSNGPEREYLSLDAIISETRPILAKNGLFAMQSISGESVVTTIYHTSGQFQSSALKFSAMDGKANNLQKMGGGLTYIKRYALSAALYIAADEDSDGSEANVTIKNEGSKAKDSKLQPKIYTLDHFNKKKDTISNLFGNGKSLDDVTTSIKNAKHPDTDISIFSKISTEALTALQDLRDKIQKPAGAQRT